MTSAQPLPRPSPGAQLRYLRRLFAQPHRVLEELSEHHGPVVVLGAGPARLAIVGDPAAITDLFAEPTGSFRWNHKFNVLALWIGKDSMLTSDGADHHRRRRSVQAGFSRRRLNGWIPMIRDATDASIDRLIASLDEPAQAVDMYPVGRTLVLDIVLRALCGPRLAAPRPGDRCPVAAGAGLHRGSRPQAAPPPVPPGAAPPGPPGPARLRRHHRRRDRPPPDRPGRRRAQRARESRGRW